MRLALESFIAAHMYDQSVQKSATEFAELAVKDLIEDISQNEKIPSKTRDFLTDKLTLIKLSVMFPDEIFNLTKIDGLYDELDFKGNEPLPELHLKLYSHYRKLHSKPRKHWTKRLTSMIDEIKIRYFAETDVLSKS